MAVTSVIRRKLGGGAGRHDRGHARRRPGLAALALARAARDVMKLPLEVPALQLYAPRWPSFGDARRPGAVRGAGGAGRMGLLVLSPPILQGLIEQQTLGRVQSHAASPANPPAPMPPWSRA